MIKELNIKLITEVEIIYHFFHRSQRILLKSLKSGSIKNLLALHPTFLGMGYGRLQEN